LHRLGPSRFLPYVEGPRVFPRMSYELKDPGDKQNVVLEPLCEARSYEDDDCLAEVEEARRSM